MHYIVLNNSNFYYIADYLMFTIVKFEEHLPIH